MQFPPGFIRGFIGLVLFRKDRIENQGPPTPHGGRTGVLVGGGVANRREAALFFVPEPQIDRKIAVTLIFAPIFFASNSP